MKYKKFFFSFLFVLFSLKGFSVNMNVSIFSDLKVSSFSVKIKAGKYTLIDKGNSEKNIHLQKNDSVNFTISNKHIFVSVHSEKKVQYDSLEMKGAGINAFFSISLLKPSLKEVRSYEDNLDLYVANENFIIVNTIELEKYISGVVECEGGNLNAGEEFLKVQAIICRSYAVKNMKKHIKEGYQLCDQVHCQVYRGKCKDKSSNIRIATYKTSGDVIVNDDNEIISATFHSNSGGQTVNSEDIWNKPLPYLRSVTDSFSMKNQHTNWEKKINKKAWFDYLAKNYNYPINDSVMRDSAIKFHQNTRKAYFPNHIPLHQIRNDFRLNSTFFSIYVLGDSLVFKGKGYGHGVGLSQEGAAEMSKRGYKYLDIIKFYYKNIKIVNFEELKKINKDKSK